MKEQKGVRERVTGTLKFVNDIKIPNLLHGKFVRLRCARAKLNNIEVQQALKIPGVLRIFTSCDFKEGVPRFGPMVMSQPVLAEDVTRFSGEPVAFVVAESEKAAESGVNSVRVEYEELPPVLTVEDAISDNAPLIHEPQTRPGSKWKYTNIMEIWEYSWGDVKVKERDCALVIENTYRAPFVHHFAMEISTAISIPDSEGLTILTPVQNPFLLRHELALMLRLPVSKVRVKPIDLGGSFGSKGYSKIEPAAAIFSWILKQPLKITLTPEESFLMAQREASRIDIRTGFNSYGHIVFQDIDAKYLIGAYEDISPKVVSKSSFHATGPYRTPNARIRAYALFSSTPPTTAYRGFGNTHTAMAVEGQLNLAAGRMNIDPVEIRLRNLASKGEQLIESETPVDGDWAELLKKAAHAIGWHKPKKAKSGRGIAFGMKASKAATISNARVILNFDGSVSILIGTTEMGQGTRTVMCKIVSDALGIPMDRIDILLGDTSTVPFDTLTAASRSVVNMGNALLSACEDIKKQIQKTAEEVLNNGEVEAFNLKEGKIFTGKREVQLQELLQQRFGSHIIEIVGNGYFHGRKDQRNPLGGPTPFFETVVTAVELQIDEETGQVTIKKIVHSSDVGKTINPKRACGVDEGGNVMGIGISLSEQLHYGSSGELLNGSSLDYRMPTIMDIPEEMLHIFQENQDGPGPQGSKGLGEGGILAVAPAICGAILDCTDYYFTEIPITSERLWKAIHCEGYPGVNRQV